MVMIPMMVMIMTKQIEKMIMTTFMTLTGTGGALVVAQNNKALQWLHVSTTLVMIRIMLMMMIRLWIYPFRNDNDDDADDDDDVDDNDDDDNSSRTTKLSTVGSRDCALFMYLSL